VLLKKFLAIRIYIILQI